MADKGGVDRSKWLLQRMARFEMPKEAVMAALRDMEASGQVARAAVQGKQRRNFWVATPDARPAPAQQSHKKRKRACGEAQSSAWPTLWRPPSV